MTAREFVHFAASAKGVAHGDRTRFVNEALARCNLTKVADQLISQLSRGFRQRVGLAQAIVNKPKVLILDEPTVGLDPAQILDIRTLIKDIAQNSTVLLSTHILPEVEAICSRVIIISGGRIRALDTPETLTQSLSSFQRIQLEIQGAEAEAIESRLKDVEGVISVNRERASGFVVEANKDTEVRPRLARAVVEQGWDLLNLHQLGMKLEDIFLKVVTAEAPLPAPSDSQPEVAEQEPVEVGGSV